MFTDPSVCWYIISNHGSSSQVGRSAHWLRRIIYYCSLLVHVKGISSMFSIWRRNVIVLISSLSRFCPKFFYHLPWNGSQANKKCEQINLERFSIDQKHGSEWKKLTRKCFGNALILGRALEVVFDGFPFDNKNYAEWFLELPTRENAGIEREKLRKIERSEMMWENEKSCRLRTRSRRCWRQ